jgi:hypothetical protein
MPYGLASLSDQFKHTAFGESILLAHFGSGPPGQVLSHQAPDRLCIKPLSDSTFSAMVETASMSRPWSTGYICQQGGVHFKSS